MPQDGNSRPIGHTPDETTDETPDETTRVLIAGGGPVGMALAIELGRRGIDCIVAERRDGRLRVPKMSSVSARGMEFCRRWGIAETVRYAVWERTHPQDFVYVTALAGDELARLRLGSYAEVEGKLDYSPEGQASCPQIYFDPILAETVHALPQADLRHGLRLDGFTQDERGVTARLTEAETGRARTIRADYLVGCDGANGIVRETLGIPLEGQGTIATSVNVFFRSPDLIRRHDKGWAHNYRFLDGTGCWGEVLVIDGRELYRLSVFNDPAPDLTGQSYLARLAGTDFEYEIIDVAAWERRDHVAARYREGRVMIAGDAAHEMSPTAGSGMHTGLCEAVNLAWKLQASLQGWGGENLLDSYDAECRPVARWYVDLSTQMFDALADLPGADGFREMTAADPAWPRRLTPPSQVKAQITYDSSPICVPDGTPPLSWEERLKPAARPGTRAPHCWISDGRSTMDLFGDGFVLLRIDAPEIDANPLKKAAESRGVPFRAEDIGGERAAEIYGQPLVLVRPDGHVAWRGDALPEDCAALIDTVRGA